MDLDAFCAAHADEWRELERLVSARSLNADQTDRLVVLYQRVGTHLSVVRSTSPDPALVLSLSNLLARTRRRMGWSDVTTLRAVKTFFLHSFPAALYRLRRWWVITWLVNVIAMFAYGWWFVRHPELESMVGTPGQIQQLVEHDFADYYSTDPASHFAFRVWINNAFVAAQCIAFGVLGFPVVGLLFSNSLNVGLMGGIMWAHGKGDVFFGLILPHGLLELTCVYVAGGAGLKLFWSWVSPGPRRRIEAVAREGRTTIGIALGLAVVLGICGLIEAFVTPSGLPTFARVGIGVLAFGAFLAYVFVLGRQAVALGHDGDVSVEERGENVIAVD